ncbi:hypothetical protein FWC63_00415 [Candidatus Saccharibacteria bacterium]|nr:hypothetical protein [Candidatus Saccharibacteria bacterium]
MKKQIIGTVLASAVILAAVGAAGFMNDRMEAGSDGAVEVSIVPPNASCTVNDPLGGNAGQPLENLATISVSNYPIQVSTVRSNEIRYFLCHGADIANCGIGGVGLMETRSVSAINVWTNETFVANFNLSNEGRNRIVIVGYINGVEATRCSSDVNIVDPAHALAPGMVVQDIPGGHLLPGGIWELPEGDLFDVVLSYNNMEDIDSVTINGVEVPFSNCVIVNQTSGQVRCRIDKSDYPENEDGIATIVICGTGTNGERVCVTINTIDPDAIDVPDTGVGGGFLTMASEDAFLAIIVALLAMGLATVYILFRRASRAQV